MTIIGDAEVEEPQDARLLKQKKKKKGQEKALALPSSIPQLKVEGQLKITPVAEQHHHDVQKSSGPGQLLSGMIAIGFGLATGGAGAGLGSALMAAGGTQLTLNTLSSDFNPVKGLKKTCSAQGLKCLAVNAGTNWIAGPAPGVNASIPQIVAHSAKSAAVRGGLNVALGRESVRDVVDNFGVDVLTDAVGQVGTNYIGSMYDTSDKGTLDLIMKHGLNTGLGAGLGALKGDAFGGAAEGLMRGLMTDLMKEDEDVEPSDFDDRSEEQAPSQQSKSRKGKEKSRYEGDYEDENGKGKDRSYGRNEAYYEDESSGITASDYFTFDEGTQEWHEMMWGLAQQERKERTAQRQPQVEEGQSTSWGQTQAPARKTRHKRSLSWSSQNLQTSMDALQQNIAEEQAYRQRPETGFFGKLASHFNEANLRRGYNDVANALNGHQLIRDGEDAVEDLRTEGRLRPETIDRLKERGLNLGLQMVGTTALVMGGRAPHVSGKSATSSSALRKAPDVSDYKTIGRGETSSLSGSTSNQNRKTIKTVANSNTIRMQKTGTDGRVGDVTTTTTTTTTTIDSSVSSRSFVGGGFGGSSSAPKPKAVNSSRQTIEALDLVTPLLPKPAMIKHHVFNKFRGESQQSQKYRDFFKKHSIDIDKYTIEIPATTHISKIHVANNNWTTKWKAWIDQNSDASTKQVYQFAGVLMDEYNVSHIPIVPYKGKK